MSYHLIGGENPDFENPKKVNKGSIFDPTSEK